MTPYMTEPCALQITIGTLSAWRDGLVYAEDARRLEQHIRTCHACQARLQSFDQVRLTLRSQRTPNLQAHVWREVRTRIARERGRSGLGSRRGPVIGGAAAMAAVLVVALFSVVLLSQRGSGTGPMGSTPTVGRTPTRAPLAGWQQAPLTGPVCLRTFIVVAPSDPQTLYACRIGRDNTVAVSVSHDAGATWSAPMKTPVDGSDGGSGPLTVNPTNAQDLILAWGINQGDNFVFRSFDGGAHWKRLTDIGMLTLQNIGWAGSTAVIMTALSENPVAAAAEVYASRNGGPFVRIDQGGKLGSFDASGAYITLITGHDSTISIQSAQAGTIRSTDGGMTWRQVIFEDGSGDPLQLFTSSADGRTLAAVYFSEPTQVALSTDDGKTWRRVAALPATVTDFTQLAVAPDGALFATSEEVIPDGPPVAAASLLMSASIPQDTNIYMLAPRAPSWTVPVALRQNGFRFAVQWDVQGHPATLWAIEHPTGACCQPTTLVMHQL